MIFISYIPGEPSTVDFSSLYPNVQTGEFVLT
jgi:hypothetical protein